MIEKAECYAGSCDGCGKDYQESFTGFTIWVYKDDVSESMTDNGWHITDDGKTYCDDCHEIDENDNVIIKQPATNNERDNL